MNSSAKPSLSIHYSFFGSQNEPQKGESQESGFPLPLNLDRTLLQKNVTFDSGTPLKDTFKNATPYAQLNEECPPAYRMKLLHSGKQSTYTRFHSHNSKAHC